MDLVIRNARIYPNDGSFLEAACVHVRGETIVYVGEEREPEFTPERVVDAGGNLIVPSFFNMHSHVAMNVFRGFAEGLPLQEWLFDRIFPAEEKLTDEIVYWSSLAAMCELVRGGCTGFNDMYDHCGATARAAAQSGMRAFIARGIVSRGLSTDQIETKLREAEDLFDEWDQKGRIRILFAPHAQYTNTDSVVEAIGELAKRHGTGIHTHLSETRAEHAQCLKETGKTPAAYFESLGLMDVPFIAAHGVYMDQPDMEIFAAHNASVASCVRSNLKLGSGIPPLTQMQRQGVLVSLGTDGASSNNRLSMMSEMDIASLTQKGYCHDSLCLQPEDVLTMACATGPRVLGLRSGRLLPGWNGDMILIDTGANRFTPHWNDLSALVYAAQDCCVTMTICGGDILFEEGHVTFCDEEEVLERLDTYKDIFR